MLFAVGDAVKMQLSINAGKNKLTVDDGTRGNIKSIGTIFFFFQFNLAYYFI